MSERIETKRMLTLREIMRDGRKGAFAQALYRAYSVADEGNQSRLERAFPGLKRLDEPMRDPFSIDLTEGAEP